MVKIFKRSAEKRLGTLKALVRNPKYITELAGEKPPYILLTELGGSALEEYYKKQAPKYSKDIGYENGSNKPDLNGYCFLYVMMLKYSKGNPYLSKEDQKYAKETVVTLNAIVNRELDQVEAIKKSDRLQEKKEKELEEIYKKVVGYVRAISTLSSTDYKPYSSGRRKKKL